MPYPSVASKKEDLYMDLLTSRTLRARIARAAAAFIIFGAIAAVLLPSSGVTAGAYAGPCLVPCLNGMVVGGVCTCPTGDTLLDGDVCQPVTCINGTVVNGTCTCPPGAIMPIPGVCETMIGT